MPKKRLVIRLSSLGDVILASTILQVESLEGKLDWVIAREWSEVLYGHSKIHRLIPFDRKTKLKGWVQLCRQAWQNKYDEVYDLHRTWRTRIMKILFFYWGLGQSSKPVWRSISKQRGRTYSYFIFKALWPKRWRPTSWVTRYSKVAGGRGGEHPDLRFLIQKVTFPDELQSLKKPYLCIMPSSQWDGKKWPVQRYVELIRMVSYFPVILGTTRDSESLELCQTLEKIGVSFFSGVGKWSLSQTAAVLSQSIGYLGSDTGLAHLAEAVGVSAFVIFGPTTPDMGFRPWGTGSRSITQSLWCSPCGKDGRFCFRLGQKYQCLKGLNQDQVLEQFTEN